MLLMLQPNPDDLEMLSGLHNWNACSHARPTYCNVCREALSGVTSHGLSCEGREALSGVTSHRFSCEGMEALSGVTSHRFSCEGWEALSGVTGHIKQGS